MSGLSQAMRKQIFEPSLLTDASKGDSHDKASAQGIIATQVQIKSIIHGAETAARLSQKVRDSLGIAPGICMDCNEEISEGRLRAVPFATRCTGCESEAETARARRRK